MKRLVPAALLLAICAGASRVAGQQTVPFSGGIPVAPTGLAGKPLPKMPIEYDTGEGQRIRVSLVANGLANPWSIAFLPDGALLVTEREGRLRIVRNGQLDPTPVAGTPASHVAGTSGLPGAVHGYMDVVLHPQFATNKFVYLSYTKPLSAPNARPVAAVARGTWDGRQIVGMKDVVVMEVGTGGAVRIVFGRDNTFYIGAGGQDPQTGSTLGGKVLRYNDDGTVPTDNPFVGKDGYRPEIFTMGHRNILGMAMHPPTGEIWANENGENGGDEINILRPGANYGWPKVSYGRSYTGPWRSEIPGHAGFEPPVVYWVPSIAVSGMTFYTGDKLPKWKGDVFVASLRTGEVPGTGHIERILFNEKLEELRRESLLQDLHQRMRDIRMGPDGYLYVLTDEKPGAVLKIEPAN